MNRPTRRPRTKNQGQRQPAETDTTSPLSRLRAACQHDGTVPTNKPARTESRHGHRPAPIRQQLMERRAPGVNHGTAIRPRNTTTRHEPATNQNSRHLRSGHRRHTRRSTLRPQQQTPPDGLCALQINARNNQQHRNRRRTSEPCRGYTTKPSKAHKVVYTRHSHNRPALRPQRLQPGQQERRDTMCVSSFQIVATQPRQAWALAKRRSISRLSTIARRAVGKPAGPALKNSASFIVLSLEQCGIWHSRRGSRTNNQDQDNANTDRLRTGHALSGSHLRLSRWRATATSEGTWSQTRT